MTKPMIVRNRVRGRWYWNRCNTKPIIVIVTFFIYYKQVE